VRLKKGGPSPTPETETYTVRRGDNLSSIARRHGLTLDEIKDANELEGECVIVPGQRLKIPEK
ncbi:MAG: LysM peptidoglycan-binding domain-containing protein, partial [Proteobacteria bacterium]|nr:LysM peptidoglycan-binding domain-containing protein [Pseudomonadota bacterium]